MESVHWIKAQLSAQKVEEVLIERVESEAPMSGLIQASGKDFSREGDTELFRGRSFTGRAQLQKEVEARQVFSPTVLLSVFLENCAHPNSDSVSTSQSANPNASTSLFESFQSWPPQKKELIEKKIGPEFLAQIFSLAKEPDCEMFLEGFLNLAASFEKADRWEEAALIYSLVGQSLKSLAPNPAKDFSDLEKRATLRLDAILGQASSGGRFEFLASRFIHDALDYRTILPMVAGTAVFNVMRATALARFAGSAGEAWYTRGLGARAVAGTFGFVGEVSTFSILGRGLRALSGESVAWDGLSVGKDLLSAALSLGTLKVFAWAGNQTYLQFNNLSEMGALHLKGFERFSHALIPQASMFLGLLASHGLEGKMGLRPQVDGATLVTDTLASMLSLGIGAQLGNDLMGKGWAQFQTELGLRTNVFTEGRSKLFSDFLKSLGEKFRDPWDGSPPGLNLATAEGLSASIRLRAKDSTFDLGPAKPALSMMGMKLDHSLTLEQKLQLRHSLHLKDLHQVWNEIYDGAEKRQYQKHGLDFEYAVVRRQDFPYLLQIGSAGLHFDGKRFVMEDFFVDPAITSEARQKLVELIAVHEYGESVFYDHHQASLLEFAVAGREGFLERYLELLQAKYFLKFRDVALHRMGKELESALEEKGVQLSLPTQEEAPPDSQDASVLTARKLRDGFRWPAELRDRYAHALDEDFELAREKVRDWASHIFVNEQARSYLDRASEFAYRAGIRAMEKKKSAADTLITIQSTFYRELHPLYTELNDRILDDTLFNEDILRNAVEEAHVNLKEKLLASADVRSSDLNSKQALKKAIEDLPLFTRSLDGHLGLLGRVHEVLMPYLYDGAEDEDPAVTATSHQILHGGLWRLVSHLQAQGQAASELEAFAAAIPAWENLSRLQDYLQPVMDLFSRKDSSYVSVLREAMGLSLKRALRLDGEQFLSMDDTTMQILLDILGQSYLLEENSEGREVPLIDLKAMRKVFGDNLEKLPEPREARDVDSWLRQGAQLRLYNSANPRVRNEIIGEFFNQGKMFGLNEFESLEKAKSRGAPARFLADFIFKFWENRSPFHEDEAMGPYYEWMLGSKGIKREGLNKLFQLRMLRDPLFRFAAEDPSVLAFMNMGWPRFQKSEEFRISMGFPRIPGSLGIGSDFFQTLLEGFAGRPLPEYEARLDGELREGFGELVSLLRHGSSLATVRRIYADSWDRDTHRIGFEPSEISEILPDLLRIDSAKDLIVYVERGLGRPVNPLGVSAGEWVEAWDQARRQAWEAWFKEQKFPLSIPEDTRVPLQQLESLAEKSEFPLGLIVQHYRNLLQRGSADKRIRMNSVRIERAGPSYDSHPGLESLFQNFPDSRIAQAVQLPVSNVSSDTPKPPRVSGEEAASKDRENYLTKIQLLRRAPGRKEIQDQIEAFLPHLKPMDAVNFLLEGLQLIDGFAVSPESPPYIFSNLKKLASRLESGEHQSLLAEWYKMITHRHRERRFQGLKVLEAYYPHANELSRPAYLDYVASKLRDPSVQIRKAAARLLDKMTRNMPPELAAPWRDKLNQP